MGPLVACEPSSKPTELTEYIDLFASGRKGVCFRRLGFLWSFKITIATKYKSCELCHVKIWFGHTYQTSISTSISTLQSKEKNKGMLCQGLRSRGGGGWEARAPSVPNIESLMVPRPQYQTCSAVPVCVPRNEQDELMSVFLCFFLFFFLFNFLNVFVATFACLKSVNQV